MTTDVRPITFNERAQEMLSHLEYRRALNRHERDAIFRLRYEAYLRDGGISPNSSERFSDAWDDVPNADLIGVYHDGELAASVRIHVSTPGLRDIPSAEVFGDVLEPFLARGQRLVDATRFVVDSRHVSFSAEMPFLTSRAVTMAAEYYGAFGYLAAVRQEHASVYKRASGHRAISEPRQYPMLKRPIVCMIAEVATLPQKFYARHPFAVSTAAERERLFGPKIPSNIIARQETRPAMHAEHVSG